MTIALLAASALLAMSGAAGAAEPVFDEMSVSVMPEYDDPRVLAVFEARLSDDVKLPHTAEFFIPSGAKDPEIGMACEVPEGQGHVCKPYKTKEDGDFRSISYQVNQAKNLFFEYYWDPFTDQATSTDGRKSFKYEFRAPESVKTLSIGIQQPLKAEDFKLDPAPEKTIRDSEGMNFNTYTFSDVKKDQVVIISANYVKDGPAVSKPRNNPNVAPVAAVGGQALVGGADQGSLRQGLLFFAGLSIVAIGAAFFWRFRSSPTPVIARPVAKRTHAQVCSSCGHPLSQNEKFCSECGGAT